MMMWRALLLALCAYLGSAQPLPSVAGVDGAVPFGAEVIGESLVAPGPLPGPRPAFPFGTGFSGPLLPGPIGADVIGPEPCGNPPCAPVVARPVLAQSILPVAPAVPRCPPPPRQPGHSDQCKWVPVHDQAGCLVDFECEPTRERNPPPCPPAPAKPTKVDRCNWIAVLDKHNCILEYECEPKPLEPCPAPPTAPDDNVRCKWVPLKDHRGCIKSYECTPAAPAALPPLPAPLPLPLPKPLPAPLPLFPAAAPPPPPAFSAFPAFPALRFPAPAPAVLGDSNNYCCYWASIGECDRNPLYMRSSCAQSCAAGVGGLSGCPYLPAPAAPLSFSGFLRRRTN